MFHIPHDALFTSEWSIHRSLSPNHAGDGQAWRNVSNTGAVFHVKLYCGPSTRWLPLFFMEPPRYWKNILTGQDRSCDQTIVRGEGLKFGLASG